jgi:hypothetical protein
VEHQIFGRTPVLEALAEVDLDAADLADALDARQLGLALLERTIGVVARARDVLEMLTQPFGSDGVGPRIVEGIVQGIGRCHAGAHVPDRYSHRRSVMAIAYKGAPGGKCGLAWTGKRYVSPIPGLAICSRDWNDQPADASSRGAMTGCHEALSEEAKS